MFKLLHTHTGRIILSILWGFGLATLFQRVCKGRSCIVYKAPMMKDVVGKTYSHDGKCFNYDVESTKCSANPIE